MSLRGEAGTMTHDVDRPHDDADWNFNARHETTTARLDRNWDDLLQELRVAQTGVQLLTGLLLTVPFQARFDQLEQQEIVVYLVTVGLAVLASGLLISPVVLHRVLFRQHARGTLVSAGQRFALAGFATLGLAVVGVCALIFDVVLGVVAGAIAAVVAFVVFATLWAVWPMVLRRRAEQEDEA
jgi:Family of unknown function (DUF6328)